MRRERRGEKISTKQTNFKSNQRFIGNSIIKNNFNLYEDTFEYVPMPSAYPASNPAIVETKPEFTSTAQILWHPLSTTIISPEASSAAMSLGQQKRANVPMPTSLAWLLKSPSSPSLAVSLTEQHNFPTDRNGYWQDFVRYGVFQGWSVRTSPRHRWNRIVLHFQQKGSQS